MPRGRQLPPLVLTSEQREQLTALCVPRPERALFLTLIAPIRPMTRTAIGHVVSSSLDRLGIVGKRRGPHALRHATAQHLLDQGLSMKEVGEYLGYRAARVTATSRSHDCAPEPAHCPHACIPGDPIQEEYSALVLFDPPVCPRGTSRGGGRGRSQAECNGAEASGQVRLLDRACENDVPQPRVRARGARCDRAACPHDGAPLSLSDATTSSNGLDPVQPGAVLR